MKPEIDAKKFNIILEEITLKFAQDHRAALGRGQAGIVGIHTRGVALAKRLAARLAKRTSMHGWNGFAGSSGP